MVAVTDDGQVGFRGTIIIYQDGLRFRSCGNLVIWDMRGGLEYQFGGYPGFERIGEFACRFTDEAWVLVSFMLHPGFADGSFRVFINHDQTSGSWDFQTGHGMPFHGRCILWSQELNTEMRALSVEQQIARWRSEADKHHAAEDD